MKPLYGSSDMPHLHLPIDHTDADLVLAANVADLVGSADLYVAWSHEGGPGAVPEVEAVLRDERNTSPVANFLAAIGAVFTSFWRALFTRQHDRTERFRAAELPRSQAGEPSA
jgi:hypothetical protein